MKLRHLPALAACLTPAILTADEPKVAMRDSVTAEELARAYQHTPDPLNTIEAMPELTNTTAPPRQWSGENILDRAQFFSLQGLATLVPKRSVLHVPEVFQSRMQIADDAQIVTWAEFYRQNRGWITTHEVTRQQAEGEQALSEEVLERIRTSSVVVVATLKGGPISVLPPPAAAEPEAKAEPAENP